MAILTVRDELMENISAQALEAGKTSETYADELLERALFADGERSYVRSRLSAERASLQRELTDEEWEDTHDVAICEYRLKHSRGRISLEEVERKLGLAD